MPEEKVKEFIYTIRNLFTDIENLPKPVIAAVNGVALEEELNLPLHVIFVWHQKMPQWV